MDSSKFAFDFVSHRGLTFVKNNFNGTIPDLKLGDDESELLALVTREIRSYIDNLEKIKWVPSEDVW